MNETLVAAYIGGLVVCYWAGYKFGAAVSWMRKLGSGG
jgi:hypothetical protein